MIRPCGLCDGTGQRLRRVPGGVVSDLEPCFACGGDGTHDYPAGRDLTAEGADT